MEKNERNNSKYNKLKAGSLRRQTKLANLQPDSLIKKKEEEEYHITLHLKLLEKEQTKPKFSRRNEIINFRAEINKIETKKIISIVNETKSWFFEKTIKMYNPLAILIKKKKGADPNQYNQKLKRSYS